MGLGGQELWAVGLLSSGNRASDEILAARIKRARELLTETDLPLATVAERAGFTYQLYQLGAIHIPINIIIRAVRVDTDRPRSRSPPIGERGVRSPSPEVTERLRAQAAEESTVES